MSMVSPDGLSEHITVKSYDVDWTGLLKLQSLFQYFQEIAGINATRLGVGFEELRKRRLFWVLSRIKVEIQRLPEWNEVVELSTWPKSVDRLFAIRDFRMKDLSGAILLNATSAWLLVDMDKGRPQRFELLPVDIRTYHGEDAIAAPFEKIQPVATMVRSHSRGVMPGDLDVNHHVNNATYIGWITDCFSPEFLGQKAVRALEVNYVSEAVFGDTVSVNWGDRGGGVYDIEVLSMNGNAKLVHAVVELR